MEPFLRSIEDESIAALRRLVEVNSFTHNRAGVVRVGEMVEEMFAPLGFAARRVPSEAADCGDHLVLKREGPGKQLLLVAHLDTVYPEDWAWREDGNLIYGPGACDIKGGIVLLSMVLRALKDHPFACTLLFNATEEGGCADFPALARAEAADARACLVFEPGFTSGDATTIAVERKGSGRFRIEAAGRAAHSGHAHKEGENAIRALAEVVLRVEALTDYERDVTFNVGLIQGGTAVNSVPDHAWCHVDLRAWDAAAYAWGKEQVEALASEHITVAELPGYPPWPSDPASAQLRDVAFECARELGQDIVAPRRAGGSDGCHLFDLVPTLDGLGPIGRDPHQPGRESVDRTSFVPRALLTLALLEKLA